MDRRPLEPVLLGTLAVVALAAAAATLPSATETGGGSGSGPPGPGSGTGDPTPIFGPLGDPGPGDPVLLLVVAVIVVTLFLLAVLRYRRDAFRLVASLVAVLAVSALLFWLAAPFEPAVPNAPVPNGTAFEAPAGSDGDATPATPPVLALVAVGLLLLGAVAVLLRSGALRGPGSAADEAGPAAGAAAVGRAAGEAADRLETADDVDNEIYRAWREMTRLLDVPRPDSSTAGEFAAAAVEAGIGRRHVAELTRLFEDVRYGTDEPTAATERRALAVLRRVEEAYASESEEEGAA